MKSKQEKIVNQFIKDVPKFGWSRDTLLGSAKKLKISTSILAKEFPNFDHGRSIRNYAAIGGDFMVRG